MKSMNQLSTVSVAGSFEAVDHHLTIRARMDGSCYDQRLYSLAAASKWKDLIVLVV